MTSFGIYADMTMDSGFALEMCDSGLGFPYPWKKQRRRHKADGYEGQETGSRALPKTRNSFLRDSGVSLLSSVDRAPLDFWPAGPINFHYSNSLNLWFSVAATLKSSLGWGGGLILEHLDLATEIRSRDCHKFSSPGTVQGRESSLGKAIPSSGDWHDQASFYWGS